MSGDFWNMITNQLIGVVIGTVSSILVSWYFYKKADIPARVAGEMTEDLLFLIVQVRLGEDLLFFDYPQSVYLPKNKDAPHIIKFWLSQKSIKIGETVLILFRVVDLKMNFGGSEFIDVTENSSMLSFPVARQGHGYYACKIRFPENSLEGRHTINFKLTDKEGNSHTQSIKIEVVSSTH